MGIITISRIATQIIAVFSLDRELAPQFEFFNDVRFFPDHIFVCINKIDLVEGDKEAKLGEVKNNIIEFFNARKIDVKETFITCGETVEGFDDVESYNNRVAEMILQITTKN
jgi:translation elongation factor EF-Tu-like GTPase